MKKIIVVFALLLSLSAIAQNFPGKHTDLLLGREVKVKELKGTDAHIGYEFYTQPKFGKANVYALLPSKGNTEPEAVVGRQFKIEEVIDNSKFDKGHYWIKITDDKETLYISYDIESEYSFPFEVIGGLKLPADFYCNYITETIDKFTGVTTYATENQNGVVFYKIKKGAAAKYYIAINIPKHTMVKGAIVLLSGNKRIERPGLELTGFPDGFGAYFELTLKEAHLLIDNEITDTRVGDRDNIITSGTTLKGIFSCLIEKK